MMKEALKKLSDLSGDFRLYHMCEAGETVMREKKAFIRT